VIEKGVINVLKQFLKRLFEPRIVRIPDKTRVMCFSKNGKQYLKVFNTENGANICFQVKSIDYANSDLKDEYHPETMFNEIESDQSVTILNQ
jgi:hypothetical protein